MEHIVVLVSLLTKMSFHFSFEQVEAAGLPRVHGRRGHLRRGEPPARRREGRGRRVGRQPARRRPSRPPARRHRHRHRRLLLLPQSHAEGPGEEVRGSGSGSGRESSTSTNGFNFNRYF